MNNEDLNKAYSMQHGAHDSVSVPYLLARATNGQSKPKSLIELNRIRIGILGSLAINFVATVACSLVMADLRMVSPMAASGIMVGVLTSCCSTSVWLLWLSPDDNHQQPLVAVNNRPKAPTQVLETVTTKAQA